MGIFSVKKVQSQFTRKISCLENKKIVFKSLPFPTWTKFREKVAKILVWKYVWT